MLRLLFAYISFFLARVNWQTVKFELGKKILLTQTILIMQITQYVISKCRKIWVMKTVDIFSNSHISAN